MQCSQFMYVSAHYIRCADRLRACCVPHTLVTGWPHRRTGAQRPKAPTPCSQVNRAKWVTLGDLPGILVRCSLDLTHVFAENSCSSGNRSRCRLAEGAVRS
jgi:hypothetical protein